jgi:hypothetical protein
MALALVDRPAHLDDVDPDQLEQAEESPPDPGVDERREHAQDLGHLAFGVEAL